MPPDNKTLEAFREVTEGYHKMSLALQALSSQVETMQKCISNLEGKVYINSDSLQSQVAVQANRLANIEKSLEKTSIVLAENDRARITGRSTIVAAWIGGAVTLLVAIMSLVLTLTR